MIDKQKRLYLLLQLWLLATAYHPYPRYTYHHLDSNKPQGMQLIINISIFIFKNWIFVSLEPQFTNHTMQEMVTDTAVHATHVVHCCQVTSCGPEWVAKADVGTLIIHVRICFSSVGCEPFFYQIVLMGLKSRIWQIMQFFQSWIWFCHLEKWFGHFEINFEIEASEALETIGMPNTLEKWQQDSCANMPVDKTVHGLTRNDPSWPALCRIGIDLYESCFWLAFL